MKNYIIFGANTSGINVFNAFKKTMNFLAFVDRANNYQEEYLMGLPIFKNLQLLPCEIMDNIDGILIATGSRENAKEMEAMVRLDVSREICIESIYNEKYYNLFISSIPFEERVEFWLKDKGDIAYRLDYDDLDSDSIVFDVGGYVEQLNKIFRKPLIDKNCSVGEHTFIGENCRITKAKIGRYCSIAPNVCIGQGEHKINHISTSTLFSEDPYKELTEGIVEIGNDVWIGNNAIILRGVTIGNGAIIGAGAVVTKDVEEFAIAVGVPAKIIKYRFNKKQITEIKNTSWWDKDVETAKKLHLELIPKVEHLSK